MTPFFLEFNLLERLTRMANSTFFGLHIDVPVGVLGAIIVGLTILGGLASGLLLCLFSLDTKRLNALIQHGHTKSACQARRVMMLLHKSKWLLVTLLFLEAVVVEMMPLVFDMFLNSVAAIFVSVGIILVFAEIIPQAVCIRHALQVSAALTYVVLFFMCLTSPITWPVGKLLDFVLGDKESVFLGRTELLELIRLQEEIRNEKRIRTMSSMAVKDASAAEDEDTEFLPVESTIMLGALGMSENTARDVLKRGIASVYSLHCDVRLTKQMTEDIFARGLQFILVYNDPNDPTNVTSVLETKALILLIYCQGAESVPLGELPLHVLPRFPASTLCSELFEALQHMLIQVVAIADDKGRVLGALTMQDVVEYVYKISFQAEMDPKAQMPFQRRVHSWKRLCEVRGGYAAGGRHGLALPGRRGARTPSNDSSLYSTPLLPCPASRQDALHPTNFAAQLTGDNPHTHGEQAK
ncbi:CBS domain-containing protein [Trypanosoma rangeli]|uniref:CBS domain-containing protein n=1 Tax=Trypanosoma rangeli TaxID=5698 RepID=A0A422NYJ0_TRYRA|nr:CBS domain-containing protein [Trypanosoma rangeli]RNF10572.1 CBS domain-containing protein [Trypanosoma rangeli]|eukprot:RNF10572.1 CBS domain-containing protein [Trypanosoma rangeli]